MANLHPSWCRSLQAAAEAFGLPTPVLTDLEFQALKLIARHGRKRHGLLISQLADLLRLDVDQAQRLARALSLHAPGFVQPFSRLPSPGIASFAIRLSEAGRSVMDTLRPPDQGGERIILRRKENVAKPKKGVLRNGLDPTYAHLTDSQQLRRRRKDDALHRGLPGAGWTKCR